MKKVSLVILLLSLVSIQLFGQHRKFGYVEIGGAGIFASANFDMRFKKEVNDGFGFRSGLGGTFGAFDLDQIFTIPVGINYIYGKGESGFIVGVNSIFAVDAERNVHKDDFKSVIISADIGTDIHLK